MNASKIIAITGATSGIGLETVNALAEKPNTIILLVRDLKKSQELVKNLTQGGAKAKLVSIYCDLANLKTVQEAAKQIRTSFERLDILINNAGGIFPKRKETCDGFEMTFSVNHLGHFLLTLELLDIIRQGNDPRIINVSSMAHKVAPANLEDINRKKRYFAFRCYANVKLFNILFTKSLHERFQIPSYCLHPGVVKTNFAGEYKGVIGWLVKLGQIFMISPQQGAKTSIYLATEDGLQKQSGQYFSKCKVAGVSSKAKNVDLRNKLWDISVELLQPYFSASGKTNLKAVYA